MCKCKKKLEKYYNISLTAISISDALTVTLPACFASKTALIEIFST